MQSAQEEVARLRGCLNDLVAIMALPALWAGGDPHRIVGTLVDALLEMLHASFVFVRVTDPAGQPWIEVARVGEPLEWRSGAREIGHTLDTSLGTDPTRWPATARIVMDGIPLSATSAKLGLEGEFGVVVAASVDDDFPGQIPRLLLEVAANQAAIGLHQARLLSDQRQIASLLDERVAQRTSELVAASETLQQEVAERQRAEDALRELERNSQLNLHTIPGLVALLSPTGNVDYVNRQLLDYFGQTVEELRQWGTNGTVHPDDLPHVIEVFSHSIATGAPYFILQRFRRADGVYRWFENSGSPILDEAGRVVRWCVLLTDIDERKHAEDALAASERNLQLTIDTIPALAWSARPDGSAEFFSQHYLDYVGLPPDQMRDAGWLACVHPEDLGMLGEVWQGIMASEMPGEAEARLRRHDGAFRWFLFRANPLRDASGAIVKWYGVNTDIEDRKRAEMALKRAHDSFADAQRLSHTGSFTADLVADHHVWSEELYRMCEFEPGTPVTAERARSIIHPDDVAAFDAGFARSLAGADFDLTFRIVTQSGKLRYLHSVAHVIDQVTAGRPFFIGAIQDVTDSKVAEEALNKARSELAHVARVASLSTLTASIAHEVNQPLSGVITNAGTCLRMLDSDPPIVEGARETARRIIRDGNRASDVIARLRALFTKREFTLEPLDLNDATREVIALSISDLQRNRVVVQSELADDLPPIIGDRVQLQQVVLNLLRNGSDAMSGVNDRPRQLVVRTERDGAQLVRLTVRDTGVGVEPHNVDSLFEAFFTTKPGGMGIGLSVSRSIVERHNGRLWVEPNDGPGASFAFSIPSLSPDMVSATPGSEGV